jgi:hypothetical protein
LSSSRFEVDERRERATIPPCWRIALAAELQAIGQGHISGSSVRNEMD